MCCVLRRTLECMFLRTLAFITERIKACFDKDLINMCIILYKRAAKEI